MSRRLTSRAGASLLATLLALVGLFVAAPPASAAPQSFTLNMVEGGGQLKLASSAEPFVMQNPTSVTGTIDDATGVMTGLNFSTPNINFQQEASGLNVDITAKFTTISATGNGDGLGNVTVNARVKLDIHLNIGGGAIVTDCVSSPVNLALVSTAPYDPATKRVTLADPNFTVPAVANDGICNSLVQGPINEQLAGPGNSIRLTLQGDLALPPPPGAPSTTTLTSNVDTTPLGFPVTFTANVAPGEGADPELDVPGGVVLFFNGPTQIGQAQLDETGQAVLTTSSLPVGAHQITARYNGNVDYEGSTSGVLVHTVTAVPTVTANIPPYVVAGGAPAPFTATITNPSSGATLPNLRLDMLFGPLAGAANRTLEWDNNGTWEVIPTTGAPSNANAQFPSATGFSLAPGETRTINFRITANAASNQGKLAVKFTLLNVNPDSTPPGAPLTTFNAVNGETWIIGADRRPTAAAVTQVNGTTTPNVTPRVGDGLTISGNINRGGATPIPTSTGDVEVSIDGEVLATVAVGTSGTFNVTLPAGPDSPLNALASGQHQVVARYKGDNLFRPSVSAAFPLTLAPWVGDRYTCTLEIPSLGSQTFAVRADAHAITPAAALAGTTVPLQQLEVTLWSQGSPGFFTGLGDTEILDPTFAFTGGATGTWESVEASTQPAGAIEGYNHFAGESGSVAITGEPGDVIDISFLGTGMTLPALPGINLPFPCIANGDGEPMASITVAGTTLATTATNPVPQGTPVPLTANVYPTTAQGLVEFFAGDQSVGLAPVSGGVAQTLVSNLPVGTHQVTAKYLGDLVNPTSTSAPVEVVVRDAIQCADQAQPGNKATVRATYLLLLGRCAEAAGFDYWVDQLDSGVSVERFAATIANTLEAHKRSVDDAYRLVLNRSAETSGRNFWGPRLQGGGRYDVLVGELAASGEFFTQAGSTNSGWVTLAYQRILQRTPDAGGHAYWLGRLNAGESRAKVAAAMVRLNEPTGTLVKEAYRAILDREPTAAELGAEVPRFQATGSRAGIYARVIGTQEFVDNAQAFPNA